MPIYWLDFFLMVFNVFSSLYLYPCWFNSWQIFFSYALNSFTFYFMSFNYLVFHFVQMAYFWDRILLCSLDWPGAHYLDHTSSKFVKICTALPPGCLDSKVVSQACTRRLCGGISFDNPWFYFLSYWSPTQSSFAFVYILKGSQCVSLVC